MTRDVAAGPADAAIMARSAVHAVVSGLAHQQVIRGTEQLADARVTAAYLDRDGRPQRQPKDWVERFKTITTGK